MINNSPHLCVQFSGVYCIHRAGQPSPLPSSRALPSPQKETLYLGESLPILQPRASSHLPLSLLLFSSSVVSDSLQPHGLKHTRHQCPSPTPGTCSNSCPSSRWCHPTTSFSVIPFSVFKLSQHQGFFQWGSSSHQVAKVLKVQLQHQSFWRIFRTDFL